MLVNTSQQKLQDLDRRIEARVQDIRAEREWWLCRRGCDACCRQLAIPPELTPEEWTRIDAAIAQLTPSVRHTIEANIQLLMTQITDKKLTSSVVCPYLDQQEGACQIYDARPIACRTYGFFVSRHHDQYCTLIEAEVASRQDRAIVWGNADAIQLELEQISGLPIPFEVHYSAAPLNE